VASGIEPEARSSRAYRTSHERLRRSSQPKGPSAKLPPRTSLARRPTSSKATLLRVRAATSQSCGSRPCRMAQRALNATTVPARLKFRPPEGRVPGRKRSANQSGWPAPSSTTTSCKPGPGRCTRDKTPRSCPAASRPCASPATSGHQRRNKTWGSSGACGHGAPTARSGTRGVQAMAGRHRRQAPAARRQQARQTRRGSVAHAGDDPCPHGRGPASEG